MRPKLTDAARPMHRAWVARAFAPVDRADEALIDLLVVATDVYTWKLLRRDRGLSRADRATDADPRRRRPARPPINGRSS